MSQEWSSATNDDGQTFVFADQGKGPLVVLWHGFPDTPSGWAGIAQALASAGYRAVAPWLRGYHPDTITAERSYDPATLATETAALLDALGEETAVVVGHDWGASLTWGAAAVTPERVRAIVPIAIPHARHLPRDPGTLWKARHFVGMKLPWAAWDLRRNSFAYIDALYRRWAPNWDGPEREKAIADVKACYADSRSLEGALDYYRALSPNLPRELTKTPAVRALVVGGTVDLVPADAFEKSAALLGAGSEVLIVEGAGHWPHREGEEAFTEKLLGFLASLD
ncbi:alpha/beta fold hydrolase [Antrihabitans sp. YC2-6]|uniref:alpha/beta fold hydrolase n=1 Tax=Antrihabitans sp. YC2-6 TaxID=2799498 RepID=UPI0018F4ADD6|nr:alpha/beta hydrolase [Antrihabitans sp. YC2-6]MBJ8344952.1 alpha/beta hydrolase [Antrihabitans sp. YC2-6]